MKITEIITARAAQCVLDLKLAGLLREGLTVVQEASAREAVELNMLRGFLAIGATAEVGTVDAP